MNPAMDFKDFEAKLCDIFFLDSQAIHMVSWRMSASEFLCWKKWVAAKKLGDLWGSDPWEFDPSTGTHCDDLGMGQ